MLQKVLVSYYVPGDGRQGPVVRVLAALPEDLATIPSTHLRQLTTARNSRWPLRALTQHILTQIYIHQ